MSKHQLQILDDTSTRAARLMVENNPQITVADWLDWAERAEFEGEHDTAQTFLQAAVIAESATVNVVKVDKLLEPGWDATLKIGG